MAWPGSRPLFDQQSKSSLDFQSYVQTAPDKENFTLVNFSKLQLESCGVFLIFILKRHLRYGIECEKASLSIVRNTEEFLARPLYVFIAEAVHNSDSLGTFSRAVSFFSLQNSKA